MNWVPIDVGLPSPHTRVLVCAWFGGPDVRAAVGAGSWMPPCSAFPDGCWWAVSGWGFHQVEVKPLTVTHWAPWPELP